LRDAPVGHVACGGVPPCGIAGLEIVLEGGGLILAIEIAWYGETLVAWYDRARRGLVWCARSELAIGAEMPGAS